jgi:acetyltransferase-like isoleucine patch superfamily enzyme
MTRILKMVLLYIKNKIYNVFSKSYSISLKSVIGKGTIIETDTVINAHCTIGQHVYIGKNCFLTKVEIGNYSSIANNVSIGIGEHDLNKISTNSLFYDDVYNELTQKQCIIGHDVWIGVDSIILRDVVIGNGAVIGANSVVTKSIPPYAVAVGSPAKIIKYRFDDKKIKQIEQSNWWDYNVAEAKQIIEKLDEGA